MKTLKFDLRGLMSGWGQPNHWVVRKSYSFPTKSGIIGMLCCAMGIDRENATKEVLKPFQDLKMGVSLEKNGNKSIDFMICGFDVRRPMANGKSKDSTVVSRVEYTFDPEYKIFIHGEENFLESIKKYLENPRWNIYMGRKNCSISVPIIPQILEGNFIDVVKQNISQTDVYFDFMEDLKNDPDVIFLKEFIVNDVPVDFSKRLFKPRIIMKVSFNKENYSSPKNEEKKIKEKYETENLQKSKEMKKLRLEYDNHLCVFCKDVATEVHHVIYRGSGNELLEDLRSLCRHCHKACTTIEYGLGMTKGRVDPMDPKWRNPILEAKKKLLRMRR